MNVGEKFNFKGYEWVALEVNEDTVTAIMTKAWATAEFDEGNSNNWETSTIRKRLQEELLPVLGEDNLVTHVTDLIADNGDKRYGTVEDKIWLLSCDEYRKYRKIILENCDFEDDWWWTLTPWYINDVGSGNSVRYVITSGSFYNSYAYSSHGVAPACVIHLASLESAPSGAQDDIIRMIREEIESLKNQLWKIEELLQEGRDAE